MSTTASMSSSLGPFGPGLRRHWVKTGSGTFVFQEVVKVEESRRFQHDCGTEDARRTHEQGTHTRDDPIERGEIGRTLPRAIEDQQLMFDEHRLSHDRTDSARTRKPGKAPR